MSKKLKKKLFLVFAVVAVGLYFLLTQRSVLKVDTLKMAKGQIQETISASGKVEADQKADLTFQTAGRVVWVGVKKGDTVKKWQGIASLDTMVLNATYQQALNTYRALEAAAQKAEDDVKDHAKDETFAQKSTRMAAQVARDNAHDTVKATQQALKFAVIVAPFDGILTQVNPAYPGVNVTALSAAYTVVNPATLYFSCEVNEIDVAKIKINQKVKLTLDAYPETEFESTVEAIDFASMTTSTGGTAYKVKIVLPKEKKDELRLGMNGDAEIVITTTSDVLSLPQEALIESADGNYVWTVGFGQRVNKKKVETGISSYDRVEVKSGLKEADLVILNPSAKLKEGSRVR